MEDSLRHTPGHATRAGTIGGTYATPLVSPPEVAIVALGRLQLLPRYPPAAAEAAVAAAAAAAAAGGGSGGGGVVGPALMPMPVSVMPVSDVERGSCEACDPDEVWSSSEHPGGPPARGKGVLLTGIRNAQPRPRPRQPASLYPAARTRTYCFLPFAP